MISLNRDLRRAIEYLNVDVVYDRLNQKLIVSGWDESSVKLVCNVLVNILAEERGYRLALLAVSPEYKSSIADNNCL